MRERTDLTVSNSSCSDQHIPKTVLVYPKRVWRDWNIRLDDFQRKREENGTKDEKSRK